MTLSPNSPSRTGVGGPAGTGKTAPMDALCEHLRNRHDIAASTNDIYTKEDAEFLTRARKGVEGIAAFIEKQRGLG